MKKIRMNSELGLLIAILLLSFGMTFIVKADFGVSVVQAPAYVLSLAIDKLSFGMANYLIQTILLSVLVVILKKFKLSFIIAFFVALLYAVTLDGTMWLFRNIEVVTLTQRIIAFICGFIPLPFAVGLFFRTNTTLMPYDLFLREVVKEKKLDLAKAKWVFDLSCLGTALIISLIAFKKVQGIGIATVFFAFTIGPILGMVTKFLDKHFEFKSFFNK